MFNVSKAAEECKSLRYSGMGTFPWLVDFGKSWYSQWEEREIPERIHMSRDEVDFMAEHSVGILKAMRMAMSNPHATINVMEYFPHNWTPIQRKEA